MSWASISREAEKSVKNKNCVSPPQEKGGEKKSKFRQSARDQGSGDRDQLGIIPARSDQDRSRSGQFCGSNQAKAAKNVAEPILAPESRSRGIRGGNRHGFSRSIWSQPPGLQNIVNFVALVPTGTSWHQLVRAGTSWYQLVQAGTNW